MFDTGRHARAKIGFVLLATEQTIEDDMFTLRPEGVGIHFARAWIEDSITVDTLSRHADDLARAAKTLLPDGSLDVICYGCTSGSLVIGEERGRSGAEQGRAQGPCHQPDCRGDRRAQGAGCHPGGRGHALSGRDQPAGTPLPRSGPGLPSPISRGFSWKRTAT